MRIHIPCGVTYTRIYSSGAHTNGDVTVNIWIRENKESQSRRTIAAAAAAAACHLPLCVCAPPRPHGRTGRSENERKKKSYIIIAGAAASVIVIVYCYRCVIIIIIIPGHVWNHWSRHPLWHPTAAAAHPFGLPRTYRPQPYSRHSKQKQNICVCVCVYTHIILYTHTHKGDLGGGRRNLRELNLYACSACVCVRS